MNRFEKAKGELAKVISRSEVKTDTGHSLNTLEWLLKLKPDADEILQLAALAHDIERGMPDRFHSEMFENYETYKSAHAERGAKIAAQIVKEAGYGEEEVNRLLNIIKHHETRSDDPDVNLVMDADSISYFDFNIEEYLRHAGEKATRKKILFMRDRCSENAKNIINEILLAKPGLNKLLK